MCLCVAPPCSPEKLRLPVVTVYITGLVLKPVPKSFSRPGSDPSFKVRMGNIVYSSPSADKPIKTDKSWEVRMGALARVQGDVKVTVSNSWGKICSFWFHTAFLQDQSRLLLFKKGLDGPHKVCVASCCVVCCLLFVALVERGRGFCPSHSRTRNIARFQQTFRLNCCSSAPTVASPSSWTSNRTYRL